MSGSLTRRQLLIRTGGASVALACFGALPMGAIADSAALSPARAATYAALLDAIDADPAYALGRHDLVEAAFAERYRSDEFLRSYADAVLDAIDPAFRTLSPDAAHAELASWGARTQPDALALVALEFEPSADTHPIVFTV